MIVMTRLPQFALPMKHRGISAGSLPADRYAARSKILQEHDATPFRWRVLPLSAVVDYRMLRSNGICRNTAPLSVKVTRAAAPVRIANLTSGGHANPYSTSAPMMTIGGWKT